jgi:hypothetical protein
MMEYSRASKEKQNSASSLVQRSSVNERGDHGQGNLIQRLPLQRRISIGSENDPLEHQAETVADQVMNMSTVPSLQKKCAHCEEEEMAQRKPLASFIQRKGEESGAVASDTVTEKVQSTKGGGNALSETTRSFMESRFGTDFSGVRIHTGDYAAQMSQELNAQAFTVGNDIYFNAGKYAPDLADGRHLLAHELTHTIQQNGAETLQRSCTDGGCETCAGGRRRLRFTVFFRTRATRATMTALRQRINLAKQILNNCCITALFDFDWRLLPGGTAFNWGTDPTGSDYSDEAENLGEGTTFNGARGIPVVVADTVPGTGGGVTVTPATDPNYTGVPYIAISVTHGRLRAIAHEGGHVGGILSHAALGTVMDGTGATAVSEEYCNAMRTLAV